MPALVPPLPLPAPPAPVDQTIAVVKQHFRPNHTRERSRRQLTERSLMPVLNNSISFVNIPTKIKIKIQIQIEIDYEKVGEDSAVDCDCDLQIGSKSDPAIQMITTKNNLKNK